MVKIMQLAVNDSHVHYMHSYIYMYKLYMYVSSCILQSVNCAPAIIVNLLLFLW